MMSRKLRLIIDLKINEGEIAADELGESLEVALSKDGNAVEVKMVDAGFGKGMNIDKFVKSIDTFFAIPVYKTTCACCGEKINEGYYSEDERVTYCSEECLEKELNDIFGVGNWREATEDEAAAIRETNEGGFFYAREDKGEEWFNLPIFWADFSDDD